MTAAAVTVHGYHRGIEDMAVYLPAIKKLLTPALYPYDAAFFLLYIRMTVFHSFVAAATRVTHMPLDWMIFLLYLISIFLFCSGVWRSFANVLRRKLLSGRALRLLQRY